MSVAAELPQTEVAQPPSFPVDLSQILSDTPLYQPQEGQSTVERELIDRRSSVTQALPGFLQSLVPEDFGGEPAGERIAPMLRRLREQILGGAIGRLIVHNPRSTEPFILDIPHTKDGRHVAVHTSHRIGRSGGDLFIARTALYYV